MKTRSFRNSLPAFAAIGAVAVADSMASRGLDPTECPDCDGDDTVYASTISEPCLGPGGFVIDIRWFAPDPPCIDKDALCSRCCKDGETAYWACLYTHSSELCLPERSCKSECCDVQAFVDYVPSPSCPGLEDQVLKCPDT